MRPYYNRGPKRGMNKLEEAFSQVLELERRACHIEAWVFEGIKFKLADKTFYTPGFLIVHSDHFELVDVKPSFKFVQDDAQVKIKIAAKLFPWFQWTQVVRLSKREGGGWERKEY